MIDAKIAAISLVEKYMPLVEIHHFDGRDGDHKPVYSYSEIISKSNAKACAIIAVEQKIEYANQNGRVLGNTKWGVAS